MNEASASHSRPHWDMCIDPIRQTPSGKEVLDLDLLSPHVRHLKKQSSGFLSGGYVDYDHVLTIVTSGHADFLIDGYRHPVAPGHMVLLPPGLRHVITVAAGETFMEHVIHFDPVYDGTRAGLTGIGMAYYREAFPESADLETMDTTGNAAFPTIRVLAPADRIQAEQLFDAMLQTYESGDPARAWRLKGQLTELLALCLCHGHLPDAPVEQTRGWAAMHRALDCLHQRYMEPELDNAAVAAAAELTPNHLSRMFLTQFGLTLRRYLTHVRLEHARNLLVQGTLTITEVAEQTGFSCIHAFSRAFHRETGMTPSACRNGG